MESTMTMTRGSLGVASFDLPFLANGLGGSAAAGYGSASTRAAFAPATAAVPAHVAVAVPAAAPSCTDAVAAVVPAAVDAVVKQDKRRWDIRLERLGSRSWSPPV